MMRRGINCALSLLIGAWLISAPARAEDYPIIGDWMIDKAIVAPWVGPNADIGRLASLSRMHLNMIVSFFPDRVVAKDPKLACTDVDYERTLFPPELIFQASLPDPDQVEIAAGLGFPSGNIPGFDVDCGSSVQSYHFANRNTLLFTLQDIIYTMDRQGKAKP
ncbi:MAG: hypothetical protein WAW96_22045 [Alphaproteobacteria bacterium]